MRSTIHLFGSTANPRVPDAVGGNTVTVLVVLVGLRKEGDKSDVYTLAKKPLRLGLIDPDQSIQ